MAALALALACSERRAIDLGEAGLGQAAEHAVGVEHEGIGEAVEDLQAVLARGDEVGGLEHLEVAGGVGDGEAGLGGDGFDVAFALGEQLDDFDALGAGEGGGDAGKLGVQGVLELSAFHALINSSIE